MGVGFTGPRTDRKASSLVLINQIEKFKLHSLRSNSFRTAIRRFNLSIRIFDPISQSNYSNLDDHLDASVFFVCQSNTKFRVPIERVYFQSKASKLKVSIEWSVESSELQILKFKKTSQMKSVTQDHTEQGQLKRIYSAVLIKLQGVI